MSREAQVLRRASATPSRIYRENHSRSSRAGRSGDPVGAADGGDGGDQREVLRVGDVGILFVVTRRRSVRGDELLHHLLLRAHGPSGSCRPRRLAVQEGF